MRKLTIVTALAFVIAACALPAFADQLDFGGNGAAIYGCSTGDAGSPIFLSTAVCSSDSPGGTIGSSTTGLLESPSGTTDTTVGFQPWSFDLPTFNWTMSASVFVPSGSTSPRAFSWGGSNNVGVIQGNITWNTLKDDSPTPQLVGNLTITSNTNNTSSNPDSGILFADFPVGATMIIDYTIQGVSPTLDAVFNHCANANGTGGTPPCYQTPVQTSGTGENGSVPGVPEVSSILLLGTGLLSAGTFVRLRRRRQS